MKWFPSVVSPSVLWCTLLAALSPSLHAADFFASPAGAGTQDGSSWANAYPQTQIQSALDTLQPGDTLNLGSGTYTISSLTIAGDGTAAAPKQLVGADTGGGFPVFQGTFDVNVVAGGVFLSLPNGANYWNIKNLTIRQHRFPISLVQSGTTYARYTNLRFENITCDSLEDALRLYNCSDIAVKNVSAIRYTKKAFRISDYSQNVTFEGCLADCTGGDPNFPGRAIPTGFFCDDTASAPIIHDIAFIDCTALNNGYAQSSSNYWNGDGYSSERGTYNLTYLRCHSYDNMDGGFDNKAAQITYQDCISAGNKRGFRHWGAGGVMTNCVSTNSYSQGGTGSADGLWVSGNGGAITVSFSTFHNNKSHQIYVEAGGTGSATVSDSILSTDTGLSVTSGAVTLSNSDTYTPASGTGTDPAYMSASFSWRGTPGDGMDSQTYGTTKGYSSARANEVPNSPPILSISASPSSGTAPLTVNFTANASDSDGTIIGYSWDFGNGQTSTLQNPSPTYSAPGTFTITCTVADNRGARTSDSIVVTATAPTIPVPIRIEAGGTTSYTDAAGNVWSADFGYSSAAGGGIADRGAVEITGTNDDRIYQTERYGVASYAVLLANGTYDVKLHFAETYTGTTAAGQRVFSVTAEGAAPAGWTGIDIFAETGGRNIALIKSGTITVTDNVLNLDFAGITNFPIIDGIEILPVASGDLPPTAPTGLVASDITTNSFAVSWSPAADDVGVASYDVLLNGAFVGNTTGTSFSVSGLSPWVAYGVTVRTRDTAGNGSVPSDPLVVKTLPDGTVGNDIVIDNTDSFGVDFQGDWPASTFTAGYYGTDYQSDNNTGKGDKSVTFTPDLPSGGNFTVYLWWTAGTNRASNVPVDIVHAGDTTTVSVNQRLNGGAWYSIGTYTLDAGSGNSVTLRNAGTNGFVIADAIRFVRQGIDVTSPSVPTGLVASNVASSSFTLSWNVATDDVGVTGYEVFVNGASVATSAGPGVSVTGLTPATTYAATVRARDAAGNWSAESAPLAVTTANPADTVAPSAPTGLSASNVGANAFVLSWTASTDNVGVTSYEVFRDGVSVATPSGTSVSISGLAASTPYAMTVRARDAAGNWSAQSTALNVTTTAASSGGGNGAVISVNLTNGSVNSLVPEDVVGAVPAANWSNTASANQTLSNLPDNTGAATTADIVFGNTSFGYVNNTPDLADPLADDARMMRSQRGQSNSASSSLVASQVPYAAYDVYVYWGGRTPQESVPLTLAVNFQLSDGSTWTTTETKYLRDNNHVWDGTYDESTATTAADAVDGQEYVVFRNVTAPTFRLAVTSGNRTGICGIQIVEHGAAPGPAAPAITSAPTAAGTYGQPFSYSVVATNSPATYAATGLPSGLAVDPSSGLISGTPTAAGSFTVALSATNAGGTGVASIALTVAPAAQNITFATLSAKTYGDAPFAIAATASSGLPVALAIASGPATLSGNTITLTGAGSVEITATQSGDANHLAAPSITVSIAVAQAAQTITLLNPGAKTYGDAPFTLTATASSTLPVTFAIISGPASVSRDTVTLTGAGTVIVTATQTGDADTLPADPVSVSFDVAKASAPLALAPLWQLYDGQPKFVSAATTPADLAVTLTYDGRATPPVYPGAYTVAAVVDDPNYAGTASAMLVVSTHVVVRHLPTLDGRVDGSVQVLSAEPIVLNGGASVSGDLLVPGSPTTPLNGQPLFGGMIDGSGLVDPANYAVTLNGSAALGHLVRRVDAVELPVVLAPPAPAGTREVVLSSATQDAGDFATVRNLTLNSNAGSRAIPPGTYGSFTANGNGGFVLGVADSTEPAIYNLQSLTLNGTAQVQIVGPVILTLATQVTLNGPMGAASRPELLLLRIASGGVILNGNAALHGVVDAPNGTVAISAYATLTGAVTADRLIVNRGGVLAGFMP